MSLEWSRGDDSTGNDVALSGQWDEMNEMWPLMTISVGDELEFVVERINNCGGMLSMDGQSPLVPSCMG